MSLQRYLTGNRVYRHGSSAPTMGTVDPTGYVERELRKRNMLETMSQRRSGLADAALQRLQGSTGMFSPGGVTSPPPLLGPRPTHQGVQFSGGPIRSTPPPQMDGMGNMLPGQGSAASSLLQSKLAAVKAQHAAEMAQQQAALKAKLAARPKVSPVGKISRPKPITGHTPPPANTSLPWDLEAQTAKNEAGYALGQMLNQIMQARQGAQRDFSQGAHQLDMEAPGLRLGVLNQDAGRGLAFSSGHGMRVGQVENDIATQRSALQQRLADVLSGADNQEASANADFNHKLASIQQALAQRLAKRAGTLGYGPVKTKAPVKKAAKKVKK